MVRLALIRLLILTSVVALGVGGQARAAGNKQLVPPGWPRVVSIPKIGVKAPVESLALSRPADAEAPYKWGDVAWYNRSARPGDPGHAVIYGHLDSTCCPAVFYMLKALKKGDIVSVQYRDGRSLSFVVQWNDAYWNAQVPTKFIYSPTASRGIVLITCAGAFHRDGTGYDHKRVVYAKMLVPPNNPG